MKTKAQRLAGKMSGDYDPDWWNESGPDEVVAELRKLSAENAALKSDAEVMTRKVDEAYEILRECSWFIPDGTPLDERAEAWCRDHGKKIDTAIGL